MADISPSIQTIFNEAIEQESQEEVSAYLDAACRGDVAKRQRVEALLRAHSEAGGFFAEHGRTIDADNRLDNVIPVGTTIGPYKLRERIGEGGMGVVYMADQKTPVRRTVALKIIKPGMDTQEVVARFEAERQALALMNHPNIAKILDVGATESERPYFVMELVRGILINEFCDKHQLDTRARLELFVKVCRAVQHAHQKGVIHRDLKPSNVLVELHDVTAVPKIIDFGVAKAINQELTERSLHTGFSQMIGTPLYMSPEQAELSGLDVDTRTDVYSLGVLLYELLSGTTPFSRETLKAAGYDELRRIIREEQPPRPSDRVTTLAAASLSTISANRKSDPRKLGQLLRGELDWIVMKALEKDRTRRYESASALAADVQHYLDDEPVIARPPSAVYRFRKFARRRRGVLVAISFVAVSLVVGTGVSLWQAAEADTARRQAETNYLTARQAVDDMYVRVAEEWLNDAPYLTSLQREFLEKAASFYETLPASKGIDADARRQAAHVQHRLAQIRFAIGQNDATTDAYRRSIAIYDALLADGLASQDDSKSLAMALMNLWEHHVYCMHSGNLLKSREESREAARAVLARAEPLLDRLIEENPGDANLQGSLANVYRGRAWMVFRTGKKAEAEPLAKQAIELMQRAIEHDPQNAKLKSDMLASMDTYARVLEALTRPDEAEQVRRQAVTLGEALVEEHPQSGRSKWQLADHLFRLANWLADRDDSRAASIVLWEQAGKLYDEVTNQFPDVPLTQYGLNPYRTHANLSNAYRRPDTQDLEKAIFHTRRAAELETNKQELVDWLSDLGELLVTAERPVESQQAYNDALAELQKFVEAAEQEVDKASTYGNYRMLQKKLYEYARLSGEAGNEKAAQEYRDRANQVPLESSRVVNEITGVDVEGNEFKLSDYRGKAVLLDVFGDWCPYCRQMYPLERSLVEQYEGRPFVLLGVNTDPPDVLRKLIEQGEVTWRCWVDGDTDGPIADAWGSPSWPCFFFIDHHGVVRREFRGAPDDEVEEAEFKQAVETIVRKAELASSADSSTVSATEGG